MQQVDTKAGVAHVELLQDQSPADNVEEKGVPGAGAGANTADAATEGEGSTPEAPTPTSSSVAGADGSPVFFLLKVRACVRARLVDSRHFFCFE